MRVTTGLGAMGTTSAPSVGGVPGRTATQLEPGSSAPGRWSGTADGLRRSRSGRGQQWTAMSELDWEELDRRHALRYEIDQSEHHDHLDQDDDQDDYAPGRYETGRYDDQYRGTRQWSDREQFASSDDGSGRLRSRAGAAPVSLRPPRRPLSSADPSAVQPLDRASSLPTGDDPTPLFTATEYVAIGDSPLYQFVADFIAIGDQLLSQESGLPALDLSIDTRLYHEVTEALSAPVVAQPSPAGPAPVEMPAAVVVPTPVVASAAVVEPAPVPGPLAAVVVPAVEFSEGRHRDGWRVAGHRPAVESGRRSAGRAPRHRAA